MDTLLLNADGAPLQVLAWERAVGMMLDEKVYLVSAYEGRAVRSPGFSIDWPAVVGLKRYHPFPLEVGVTRRNVLARDGFACQYCGLRPRTPSGRPDLDELTVDHVVPRAQSHNGRVRLPETGRLILCESWENLVSCCRPCNGRKGARTPGEAGMPLHRPPRRPSAAECVAIALAPFRIPEEWRPFIPRRRSLEGLLEPA